MKTLTVLSLAVLALFLSGINRVSADEDLKSGKVGNARVLKVKGSVTITISGKPAEPLKEGIFVQQDQLIKTGADSQAWLLFSNGTTVTVQPNTSFSIDKFLQTDFDSNKVNYTKIKTEPSISQTKLAVNEGSIIADVAKLNKGSTFQIGTPIGVAGIRGTLIQVTVNNNGGTVTVTVNLPHGIADFSAINGKQITLDGGQTITIKVDPATKAVTLSSPSPLPPQTADQIQNLIQNVNMIVRMKVSLIVVIN
jgi:hypothetical protein